MTNDTAKGLPEKSYHVHPYDPLRIIMVIRGESGYFPLRNEFYSSKDAQDRVNVLNSGLSKGQIEAMLAGSMFGWACPAADPESYEEDGTMRPIREYDISFRGRIKAFGYSHRQACEAAKVKLIKAGVDNTIYWGGSIGKEV